MSTTPRLESVDHRAMRILASHASRRILTEAAEHCLDLAASAHRDNDPDLAEAWRHAAGLIRDERRRRYRS